MATYSTDLTTLTTAESGTWVDFAAPYDSGNPAASGEQFIQGTDCYSVNTGKNNGLEISLVFDYGSNYSFGTDDVVFAWFFYFAGTNLETYANSGWRFGIGSSTSAWDWFRVGGSDYGAHKYGGWFNFAIDPTATETGTIGGGNGGNYRYFGSVPYTINEVTKGDPAAVDAIRVGRGEISVTGSSGSFSELAQYNDYNAGSTPPGTSSTSVDSGRHVLGLFQAAGGTYLWKGLMSLGLTATSVTFSDSNETIVIDDCPHTYAEFNKVEINNSSSSVTLTNITFISTATTSVALGRFEMVDNATVSLSGCSFNDMDTFIFLSNGTITSCNFNKCAQITQGGATFTGCNFNNSTSATTMVVSDLSEVTGNTFTSDGANHAVDLGTISTSTSVTWNNKLSGYAAGTTGDPVSENDTTNAAIFCNVATSQKLTVNVTTGASVPSIRNTGAGTVAVLAAVTVTIGGVTRGTPVKVLARETLGSVTTGDTLFSGFADANGEVSFSQNDNGSLDIEVFARNQGVATAAIAEDNGTGFTDETTEASSNATADMTLLPATIATNDAYYFGHQEKFTRLKLDITTAFAGTSLTIQWEFYNGSGWSALSGVTDGTSHFGNTGANIVSWTEPGTWATTSVTNQANTGALYYVRAKVTAVSGQTTTPVGRKVQLDTTRYLPYEARRVIVTGVGLTDTASWLEDTIAKFSPSD